LIEITEAAAMTDPDRTKAILTTLRDRGLRFAIDDFGTGFSSISRLRDMPVDVLKIDQSFVRDVSHDRDADDLARAAIQLALGLGKTPLAEGIETEEQRRVLVDAGCRIGQGYFFGEPVGAEEVPALIRRGFRTQLGASA
ncbi:MAG: EAL domain-containing protein, partial [Actinomycetota bacterium]